MPSRQRVKRIEIPMAESVNAYIEAHCRRVPGALVKLDLFRDRVRKHAKENLERKFRWRRDFTGMPPDIKLTRRTICKTCGVLKPTKATCGEHYDPSKGTLKASYVQGIVIPDEQVANDEEAPVEQPAPEPTPVLILNRTKSTA